MQHWRTLCAPWRTRTSAQAVGLSSECRMIFFRGCRSDLCGAFWRVRWVGGWWHVGSGSESDWERRLRPSDDLALSLPPSSPSSASSNARRPALRLLCPPRRRCVRVHEAVLRLPASLTRALDSLLPANSAPDTAREPPRTRTRRGRRLLLPAPPCTPPAVLRRPPARAQPSQKVPGLQPVCLTF